MSTIPADWMCGVNLWALGLLKSTDISRVATAGLEVGLDTPLLRAAAGLTAADDLSEAPELFRKALAEAGVPVPSVSQAARNLAAAVSLSIVKGAVDPMAAARELSEIARTVGDDDFHELDAFIYAESECEDRPDERAFFEAMVRAEALEWTERAYLEPQAGSDPALQRLLEDVRSSLIGRPLRLPAVKQSLERILVFLCSSGRTDANVRHTDTFVFRLMHCGDSGVALEELPPSYREVLEDIGGQLHDATSEPAVAANFWSTPEQLLERVRLLSPKP